MKLLGFTQIPNIYEKNYEIPNQYNGGIKQGSFYQYSPIDMSIGNLVPPKGSKSYQKVSLFSEIERCMAEMPYAFSYIQILINNDPLNNDLMGQLNQFKTLYHLAQIFHNLSKEEQNFLKKISPLYFKRKVSK